MMASVYDVDIDQGASWTLTILYEDTDGNPISLVGYTAKCQVRDAPNGSTLYLDLTPTVNGAQGRIDVVATPTQTAALTFERGFYDVLISSAGGGDKMRLVRGNVTLVRGVSA
jgi:hypothetical protein